MANSEPRVDPQAADKAMAELLPAFLDSLPPGYELRGGGRLVRTDPHLPRAVDIPAEDGGYITAIAE